MKAYTNAVALAACAALAFAPTAAYGVLPAYPVFIGPASFQPVQSGANYNAGGGSLVNLGAPMTFTAPVNLPPGARILSVEMLASVAPGENGIGVGLAWRDAYQSNWGQYVGQVSTVVTPGGPHVWTIRPNGHVVASGRTYWLQLYMPSPQTPGASRFEGVRITYAMPGNDVVTYER